MLDDLVGVIETLQQRIREHGATLRENETRTRMALVDPLLTALGWDVSDPAVVTPEYSVGGGRADYALNGREAIPAAIVEAKRLGHSLNDDERMQMLNYANTRGVRYAAVTDGDLWEFYEVFRQAPLEDRSLLNPRISSRPAHELALQLLLLWRPNLASGNPMQAKEPILQPQESVPAPVPSTPQAIPIPPPPEDGWQPLGNVHIARGATRPLAIRFRDGREREVSAWFRMVQHTVDWLASESLLTENDVPVSSGGRRNIVNTEPTHRAGHSFNKPIEISGTRFIIEGNLGAGGAGRNTRKLLEVCGVDPNTVWLRLPQP